LRNNQMDMVKEELSRMRQERSKKNEVFASEPVIRSGILGKERKYGSKTKSKKAGFGRTGGGDISFKNVRQAVRKGVPGKNESSVASVRGKGPKGGDFDLTSRSEEGRRKVSLL